MNPWIIDASLALRWFLEDEKDRDYSLGVLSGLETYDFVVPFLWHYEMGSALVGAHRRRRITSAQVLGFTERISRLRVRVDLLRRKRCSGFPILH